jgi:hypothetical protein
MIQKWVVINCQNRGSKIDQNYVKNDPSKFAQKVVQKVNFTGGVRGGQNRQKSTSGTRDPKYGIFWNFAVFYKSSPTFWPPKSTL